MVNPKKEEKKEKIDKIVLEFSNFEKNVNSLKNELNSLIEIKKNNEKDMALSKEATLKLVSSYEKKIKDKINDIVKEKEFSSRLIKDYEKRLKEKDEEIKKIILLSDDSPIILNQLEKSGIPKEIVYLKKSELCKLFNSSISENKSLSKKMELIENENKQLKHEAKVSKASYVKKIDEISNELSKVIIEKRNFEIKNENYSNEIKDLKKKILDLINGYDNNINLLKKENERKIVEIINNSAKKDVTHKANVIMLEKQIDEYKRILFDSRNKREELLQVIEQRIKESVSPIVIDAIMKSERIDKKN